MMKTTIEINGQQYITDLSQGKDISIPLRHGMQNPNAWYAPPPEFTPVEAEGFIGSVARGGSVNFFNVKYNPHGNGTHTECIGHISLQHHSLNDCIKDFFTIVLVTSIYPRKEEDGSRVIYPDQIKDVLQDKEVQSLAVRTLPNDDSKLNRQYSHTDPPYFHHETLEYIRKRNIIHLLTDLPSVDREHDEGKLLGHRAFWNYPEAPRIKATITELIYIPEEVKDGLYLLSLQVPPISLDAGSSRPVLYPIS